MNSPKKVSISRAMSCLLAGAIGDALGAPVNLKSRTQIREEFGANGISEFVRVFGRTGAVTDGTQLMVFTAEGLIRGIVHRHSTGRQLIPQAIHHALFRWLITQGGSPNFGGRSRRKHIDKKHGLIKQRAFWSVRTHFCITRIALESVSSIGENAKNEHFDTDSVVRVAPCAFYEDAFGIAASSAQITNANPTVYQSAGLFAHILSALYLHKNPDKRALFEIVTKASQNYTAIFEMTAVLLSIEIVLCSVHKGEKPTPKKIDDFGGGCTAHGILAVGLWCALTADTFEEGVIMAVNHSGESARTGMIAGCILGLIHAQSAIPQRWLQMLEHRETIAQIATDLVMVTEFLEQPIQRNRGFFTRYPGF